MREGNMATNHPSNPAIARAAQDVEAPASHEKEAKGTYHWGRGGEGNMMTVGSNAQRPGNGKERTGSKGAGAGEGRRGSLQAALEKGKEMLGLGKAKE